MDNKLVFRLVAVIAVVFFAFTFRQITISAPEIDADHAFDTDRAFSRLVRILGDETPHPVDSQANDSVRERLLTEIRTLGFSPIVRDDFHCTENRIALRCARVQNVMFWVGEQGPNAVMVASHYDSVPAGPGAGDDGAGVAASLEIAALLKGRELNRPVLVLITDGEEIGLIGAASFVDTDPISKLVGAVVSMEARGISGPVAMFQTSSPNGRDIAALKSDIKMASTSSLASDVYERMPNGTDVTQFLKLDVDVGNFAIGGSPEFYHTPRDNLAMLDKRSFFHMGVSALNTVEAFIAQSGEEPEQQWIYSDIFGMLVVALPQMLSMPLIIFSGLMALAVFIRKGAGSPTRALLMPFLAIILGVGFAIAASLIVGSLRPEAHYAAAHPWALRAVQNSAALLGALVALMLLGRHISATRLLTSAWFCLAILGGIVTFLIPGAAILFVPALIVAAISFLLALLGKEPAAHIAAIIALLVFSVLVVPTTALSEIMLFVEYAAPFTIFLVFCFVLFLPTVLPTTGIEEKLSWAKLPALGLCLAAVLIGIAIMVPAYSPAAPRGLSIIHAVDMQSGQASYNAFGRDPIPKAMQNVAPFSRGQVVGFQDQGNVANAPSFATRGVDVQIERNEIVGQERQLRIKISAPDSDIVSGRVMAEEGQDVVINSMTLNGNAKTKGDTKRFFCHGRSCRSLTLTLALSSNAPNANLQINGFRYGLGVEGQALLSARTDSALPRSWGDLRLVSTTVELR